jgi:hypothetical protein
MVLTSQSCQNWVFVSRFCFLSQQGHYEYFIEYDRKYGDLQLLLYYDEPHQWHSVYKTSKSCHEKVSVLSPDSNQIIQLSPNSPYYIKSGCGLRAVSPTPAEKDQPTTAQPSDSSKQFSKDSTYFDQFLKTTTQGLPNSTPTPLPSSDQTTPSTENFTFVDIEDFNMTNPIFRTMLFDQETQENNMENNTSYFRSEVEEMFDELDPQNSSSRTKRQTLSRIFEPERKQLFYISCHNAGGFTSVRPRWWYIALASCGSKKGMDVK